MDDQTSDQKPKDTNSQTTRTSRQNSTTSSSSSSSSILSDNNSIESVITDNKNSDNNAAHVNDDREYGEEVDEKRAAAATISPPVQFQSPRVSGVGGGGYDAGRIPASVFARGGGGTPGEWSVASNESLFSIHVANFSCSTPIFRSGDLSNLALHHPTPPFSCANDAAAAKACEYGAEGTVRAEPSAGRETRTRTHSFHFPVLAGSRDGGWISSPKMVELRRQRTTTEQILRPPQPLLHFMQRRERPQRFGLKRENNNSSSSNWLYRFSYCCVPCRRNKA